jgi:hypothetical protein
LPPRPPRAELLALREIVANELDVYTTQNPALASDTFVQTVFKSATCATDILRISSKS